MAQRKLLMLTGVLVVLGLIAYWSSRPPRPAAIQGIRAGDPILADLDLNAIADIEIASTNQTVKLARKDGIWVADSLYDYPVDFTKLRGQLTALPNLKVGQVVRGGEAILAELGLGEQRTTVTFRDEGGSDLAELRIGIPRTAQQDSQFGGMPDGHYVRAGEGPVAVVADNLTAWTGDETGWINKQLLQVTGTTLHQVSVDHPDGAYTVSYPDGGSGEVEGLAEGETTNTGNAGRLQRALSYLSFQTVADPTGSDQETGMDSPIVYTAVDQDGVTYTANIGAETADGRYARFDIAYQEPPPPTREDAEALVPDEIEPPQTDEPDADDADPTDDMTTPTPDREQRIDAELETLTRDHESQVNAIRERIAELDFIRNWTYILPAYAAESMILSRDEVVNAPEPEEELEVVEPAEQEPVGQESLEADDMSGSELEDADPEESVEASVEPEPSVEPSTPPADPEIETEPMQAELPAPDLSTDPEAVADPHSDAIFSPPAVPAANSEPISVTTPPVQLPPLPPSNRDAPPNGE